MFRRGLIRGLFFLIIVGGLLSLGGYFGWSQGFSAGLATAVEGGVPAYVPFAAGMSPVFWGVGLLFKVAFLFLFFMIFMKLIGMMAFRRAGGRFGGWKGHRGHHHHGHGHDDDNDASDDSDETGNMKPTATA